MKVLDLLLLLGVDGTFAMSLAGKGFDKHQRLVHPTTLEVNCPTFGLLAGFPYTFLHVVGGLMPDPGIVPRKEILKSDIAGAKRIKIRSGPYLVGNMKVHNYPGFHAGMLESYPDCKIEKPCEGECSILRQLGGLEYTDGKNANIDTGLWLHHMVHFVKGPGRWDAVAYGDSSCLPHKSMGISVDSSERYFVTGNERSQVNYFQGDGSDLSTGTAYQLHKEDEFRYLIELMNMNSDDKVVYVTMTYDILEGPLRPGWKEVKSIYLDANSCKTSEVMPTDEQQTGRFNISSVPWKPTVEGKVVYAMGHLHDGGVAIDVTAGPNSVLCNSTAIYSNPREYYYPEGGKAMGGDLVAKNHISQMPGCEPGKFQVTEMKRDQSWVTTGYYDYQEHEGNKENKRQAEIMAIAVLMVAVEPGVKPILT